MAVSPKTEAQPIGGQTAPDTKNREGEKKSGREKGREKKRKGKGERKKRKGGKTKETRPVRF